MAHPSHNHIPAYQRPGFRQSLGDRGGWVIDAEASKQDTCLTYHRGDEVAVVPSIWYNQPVEWRIEAMRFYAQRARDNAAKRRADSATNPKPWDTADIEAQLKQAERLDALADKMHRTGEVLA